MNAALAEAERLAFSRWGACDDCVPVVFILGSPRTGSTLCYQVLVDALGFFPINNLVNDCFSSHPILGALLSVALDPGHPVGYSSKFGKTDGPFGPSEGSAVFKHWFGGDHPSATRSAFPLDGRGEHLVASFRSIASATGRTPIAKNAWNCFRIPALARLLPQSFYVWIRREIGHAASSDLDARKHRGSVDVWNSATPSNIEALRMLPYWEQVVEQQFEYNRVIDEDLASHRRGQFHMLWYEDLCRDPQGEVERLAAALAMAGVPFQRRQWRVPDLASRREAKATDPDHARVLDYVAAKPDRFAKYRYPGHR